jgi:hypothetical protein
VLVRKLVACHPRSAFLLLVSYYSLILSVKTQTIVILLRHRLATSQTPPRATPGEVHLPLHTQARWNGDREVLVYFFTFGDEGEGLAMYPTIT